MTETQMDPEEALTLLVGLWGRMVRDLPFYPDASLWEFFDRVCSPWGFPAERVLNAMTAADLAIPESLGVEEKGAKLGQCFEAIGLGALWSSSFEPSPTAGP